MPLPNPEGNKEENKTTVKNDSANDESKSENKIVVYGPSMPANQTTDDHEYRTAEKRYWKLQVRWQAVGAIATILAFVAAAFYACLAHQQVTAMNDTAKTTREALTNVQRAFVTQSEITMARINDNAGKVLCWEFAAVWQNSGVTPTKGATMHVSADIRPSAIPNDFGFPDLPLGSENPPFVLGPKATATSGARFRVAPSDIVLILNGRRHFYIWGWVRYRDIFEGTVPHITEFCDELTGFGDDPFSPHTDYPRFFMTECSHHNCADEGCKTSHNADLSKPK